MANRELAVRLHTAAVVKRNDRGLLLRRKAWYCTHARKHIQTHRHTLCGTTLPRSLTLVRKA